jgi:hypothetical protein
LIRDQKLAAVGDPPFPFVPRPAAPGGLPQSADDLAYRVEVWDDAGLAAEQLVAVTSTASLGYAVFYAAAREYAGRDLTLSHKGAVLSRWHAKPL